jgi:hypothetical protein
VTFPESEENTANENKRVYKRYAVTLDVQLDAMSVSSRTARIADISLGGCYIMTMLPVDVGEIIELEIPLPSGRLFPVRGTVAFRDPHIGFGVKFDLHESEIPLLSALIDYARPTD